MFWQKIGLYSVKGAEAMYQEITDTKNYPVMHNPEMSNVLSKLSIQMTSIEEWVTQNKFTFTKND